MNNLFRIMKSNKGKMLLIWVIIVLAIYFLITSVALGRAFNALQALLVFAVAIISYYAIFYIMDYAISNKKIFWINTIYSSFDNMQIFIEKSDVTVQIPTYEVDNFMAKVNATNHIVERVYEGDGFTKYIVKQ